MKRWSRWRKLKARLKRRAKRYLLNLDRDRKDMILAWIDRHPRLRRLVPPWALDSLRWRACAKFTDYLIRRAEHFDSMIIRDITPTDGWVGHVSTGIFPPGDGITRQFDKLHRVYPDMSAAWEDAKEGDTLSHLPKANPKPVVRKQTFAGMAFLRRRLEQEFPPPIPAERPARKRRKSKKTMKKHTIGLLALAITFGAAYAATDVTSQCPNNLATHEQDHHQDTYKDYGANLYWGEQRVGWWSDENADDPDSNWKGIYQGSRVYQDSEDRDFSLLINSATYNLKLSSNTNDFQCDWSFMQWHTNNFTSGGEMENNDTQAYLKACDGGYEDYLGIIGHKHATNTSGGGYWVIETRTDGKQTWRISTVSQPSSATLKAVLHHWLGGAIATNTITSGVISTTTTFGPTGIKDDWQIGDCYLKIWKQ